MDVQQVAGSGLAPEEAVALRSVLLVGESLDTFTAMAALQAKGVPAGAIRVVAASPAAAADPCAHLLSQLAPLAGLQLPTTGGWALAGGLACGLGGSRSLHALCVLQTSYGS